MESLDEMWAGVCEAVQQHISGVAFNTWIAILTPVSFDGSTVTLHVKTDFQRKVVLDKYSDLLKTCFEGVLGFDVALSLTTDQDNPAAAQPQGPAPAEEVLVGDYAYTFDTFIVGPSNKFAHAACLAVANNPAGAYNPLFIHGGSGLGKTHLLYAIYNEIGKSHPDKSIVYIKGADFTNDLIEAIRFNTTGEFRSKYRKADVLLVDDIQFIAGKESTQEEFFHTFNYLFENGSQIVLTSDRPPKEIYTLEDRLRTRFEWGLLADVAAPDFETRLAIINRKAELLDIAIPKEVAEFIANKLKTNIRQLEGVVKKIKAYNLLSGDQPSLSVAQSAIKDILNDNQPEPVTIERVVDEVSRIYGVSPTEIRGKRRTKNISIARQVCMYIIREITQMPLSSIGEEFGRDHSTVIYNIEQCENDIKQDKNTANMVQDIIKNLTDQTPL
jgi:chromosomal replication initiator protein